MKRKNLNEAINYILSLNSPTLFCKGNNFAQFECGVYGWFEIMFDHVKGKWMAYREHGNIDAPKQQLLFYFN